MPHRAREASFVVRDADGRVTHLGGTAESGRWTVPVEQAIRETTEQSAWYYVSLADEQELIIVRRLADGAIRISSLLDADISLPSAPP